MAKVLVIDDEAVIREPIAASLRANGHRVTCAANGSAAFAQIRSEIPDVILLDIRMPEKDGISVLRDLRAATETANVPVLLLSNSTDKTLILQAAQLGIQSYILKSAFSLNELLDRINRFGDPSMNSNKTASSPTQELHDQLSPTRNTIAVLLPSKQTAAPDSRSKLTGHDNVASWPKLLTREQTLERLDQVASGKALAGVVAQLISVANSPDADLSDVVRVIESDPILAARVIQLANSASSANRGRVRNVEDAARNLGVRDIQNMAMSIGIVGAFPPDEQDGFNTMRCWQHSYAVADLLNLLMRSRNSEQESLNHLIGLCHDLGEILLRQHFVAEHEQIIKFAIAHGLPAHEVESVALGIRHPEMVSRLLARIGLPVPAVHAIREFYERQIRGQAAGMSAGALGLSLANLAAHGLLLAPSTRKVVRPVTRTEWRQLSSDKAPPAFDPALKRVEILTATNVLARLSAKEEQRLLIPPIPRHAKRVRYVRPESFVEFDPLAFALSLSCELEISADLPQGNQWQDIDAMILVSIRIGVAPIIPDELLRAATNAARGDLPILALTANEWAAPNQNGQLLVRAYPISLDDLNHWLSSIPARRPCV